MAIRLKKINLMHAMFGVADGVCSECEHFVKGLYHTRILRKCEIYGLTHSEATDWRQSYQACGLKNRDTIHQNVFRLVQRQNELPTSLAGQIEMEFDNEQLSEKTK